jgi:hypothetical protein
LNCELALRETTLSPRVSQKLQVVQEMAQTMRRMLEGKTALPNFAAVKASVTRQAEVARAR